jgi:hypothetical protein
VNSGSQKTKTTQQIKLAGFGANISPRSSTEYGEFRHALRHILLAFWNGVKGDISVLAEYSQMWDLILLEGALWRHFCFI